MRIPVFSRGSNPRVDRPILRKSLCYGLEQVENRLADWVDPIDPGKGIIARELLPSGKAVAAEPEKVQCLTDKALGIKVIPAKMDKNPTLPRLKYESLVNASVNWEWPSELPA